MADRWEYRVVEFDSRDGGESILQDAGREGFAVVAALPVSELHANLVILARRMGMNA
ncbi:MAG: hypothetical protein M3N31_03765 [Actinomycetota bacterium]|nr:hypothetical protein [Actinomycetota bacterium]